MRTSISNIQSLCTTWSALFRCAPLIFFTSFCIASCKSNPGPPPSVRVTSITDLGPIPVDSHILGRDGAYSGPFAGVSVWIYGDTFLTNPNADGRTLISDSWSHTSDLTVQGDGISSFQQPMDSSGAPAQLLPETPSEHSFNQAHSGNPCQTQPCGDRWALWPSSIVADTVNNRALIFYSVVSSRPGTFNFQAVGNSVALWSGLNQPPLRPSFTSPVVPDHPDLMFNANEPNFGTDAFIKNSTLYVYGCGTPTNGADKGCRLAKVDPSTVQDRSTWAFFSSNGNWSPQLSDATSVFTGSSIVSVAWNDYLQRFVAVYSPPFSQHVMIRTAPRPEGPWSAEMNAFDAKTPASGNVYDAHAHPEYDSNSGQTIYISYSRSTGTFASEVRLVAVQLQRP